MDFEDYPVCQTTLDDVLLSDGKDDGLELRSDPRGAIMYINDEKTLSFLRRCDFRLTGF